MPASTRNLRIVAIAVLITVAILGYRAGHSSSTAAPAERTRTALTSANILLTYPSDWLRVAGAPEIPGLSLSHTVVVSPHGDGAHAGLIVGQLVGGEASPLPSRFVAGLRGLPDTQVVDLAETQAYRYSRLSVPGFERMLTLYAIPNPGGNPTVLACYASATFSADARTCEQIVAALTLVGLPQSYALSPDPAYARGVRVSIGSLDVQRLALRREMRGRAAPSTVKRLATRAAQGFANAAASLSTLEPPSAAGQAHAMLIRSLGQARAAYTALAAAADAGDQSRYAATRTRVYKAEASISTALESFALLDYK
jgi:hypothetical protein